jgi:AcrR family transcriptional regulator
LLAAGGREAVSTRAVSVAAGVQAPTIYRLFGDKQGLLEAVAEYGVRHYLASKMDAPVGLEPVEDLRRGWDQHVAFGLENPALYALIYGEPRPGPPSPAEQAATAMLARKIQRIAECGRLRVSETLSAELVHALASGATLAMISMPPSIHRQALAELAREAAISAITTMPPAAPVAGAANLAVALRAALPQTSALTSAELRLLQEWLDRIATPGNA